MAPTTKGLLGALLLAATGVNAQQAKLQVDLDSPGEHCRPVSPMIAGDHH